MVSMKKISAPLVIFLCTFSSLALSATTEYHLANAIKCLRVVSGEEIHDAYDINHNGNIGLDDIIHELILVSGEQIQAVSIPTLRMNLPGSWYSVVADKARELKVNRNMTRGADIFFIETMYKMRFLGRLNVNNSAINYMNILNCLWLCKPVFFWCSR